MIRTLFIFVAIVATAIPFWQVSASEDTVSFHCSMVPPFMIEKADGTVTGIVVEISRALIQKAGFKPSFQKLPWNRAIEYIKTGQLDMMTLLSKTPERETFIHFIGECLDEQVVVIVRKEDAQMRLDSLDDFTGKGRLFGIRQNFFYSADFNRRLETDTAFRKHFDFDAKSHVNFKKVEQGRLTGALGNYIIFAYILKDHPKLTIIKTPFFQPSPTYFGLSKAMTENDPKMIKLKAAHRQLTLDGTFKRILKSWVE